MSSEEAHAPNHGEQIALAGKAKGKGFITSTRHIRPIVFQCFDDT